MTVTTTVNRLLASLPAEELRRLAPRLERVTLDTGLVVCDVLRPIDHVYFPEDAVISIVSVMADGKAVETATVGREGVSGLSVFFGVDRVPSQAFVQVPGDALRLAADDVPGAVAELAALRAALGRYSQALFTLASQSSGCNRLHTMSERCARWLLHTHDRVSGDTFALTHRFLSQMLGVRRATVTEAMGALHATGSVSYARGRVVVLDRARLEASACECYAIIAGEFGRLLGGTAADRASPLADLATSNDGHSTVGDGAPRAGAAVR